jgi:hypothetical protein
MKPERLVPQAFVPARPSAQGPYTDPGPGSMAREQEEEYEDCRGPAPNRLR